MKKVLENGIAAIENERARIKERLAAAIKLHLEETDVPQMMFIAVVRGYLEAIIDGTEEAFLEERLQGKGKAIQTVNNLYDTAFEHGYRRGIKDIPHYKAKQRRLGGRYAKKPKQ